MNSLELAMFNHIVVWIIWA